MKPNVFKNRVMAPILAVMLTLCLCFSVLPASAVAAVSQSAVINAPITGASLNDDAAYLSRYFDIRLDKEFVSMAAYAEALLKLQPAHGLKELVPQQADYGVGALDGVKYAVIAANMEELALVYSPEKINAALVAAGAEGIDAAYAPYVACALDLQMITPAQAKMAKANNQADIAYLNSLLMAVADVNGVSRNFLGYTDDPDIYAKFINVYESFELFDDARLAEIGSQAVINQVTTGYNLKSGHYDARFLPELTLIYGHSNIKHAAQLLGLLQSEGIAAKVQFEPKVSIYQYLPEWGEPGEPTPTYAVKTVNDDLMLAYATEYDMVLEFASQEDMDKLDSLILDYAKKNSGEEGKALLAGSWWQPLYYAHVEMGDGYHMIYDNVITNGNYSLHPFCLPEAKADVLAKFKAIDPAIDIEQVPIWCDAPFYRYLNGLPE